MARRDPHSLLVSDLDGTLIPNAPRYKTPDMMKRFQAFLDLHPQLFLAYCTGRDLRLIQQACKEFSLPTPDVLVADVGTTIYFQENGKWQPDAGWRDQLLSMWQGRTQPDIAQLLSDVPHLREQEPVKLQEFKQSYYLDPARAWAPVQEAMEQRLHAAGVRAQIIYSLPPDRSHCLIDVLPEGAAKDAAALHLRDHFHLADDQVVYAGDSGNDLLALTVGLRAIVVNNTHDDVKKEAKQLAQQKGVSDKLYFASGRYNCGEGNFADGVMEGCLHFGLFREAVRAKP